MPRPYNSLQSLYCPKKAKAYVSLMCEKPAYFLCVLRGFVVINLLHHNRLFVTGLTKFAAFFIDNVGIELGEQR